MIEPVSRPIDTRGGVRSNPRRAPAPPSPQLSAEAAQLLAGLAAASEDQAFPEFERLIRTIAAKPSRPGAEVLDFFAAAYRNAGNEDAAERLTLLHAVIANHCGNAEAFESGLAKMNETAQAAIGEAYALGFAAGQAELRKQLPAVVRETEFKTADVNGGIHIVGKVEKEYRTGGTL